MHCSLLGASVHGIFQARVLEWVAIAFSETLTVGQKTSWFLKKGSCIMGECLSKKLSGDFWTKGYGSALLAGGAMSSADFLCM